jgi:hypothetical protein
MFMVDCCVCPPSRFLSPSLVLRCLTSRVGPSPPCLTCRILASHHAHLTCRCHLLQTCIALCPLAIMPLPSLALRCFVYLPGLYVGRALVVASLCPRLASPVLLSVVVAIVVLSIAMMHQRRDAKSPNPYTANNPSPQPPQARAMLKRRQRHIGSNHVPRWRLAQRSIVRRMDATVRPIAEQY